MKQAQRGMRPRRLEDSPTGLEYVTAAVLAGGLGTRLRPVVADRPKVLAEVCGKPFLVHLLDRLEASGIRRTVLLTGYGAEQVRQIVGFGHGGMKLIHSAERQPLGTGGAIRNALPALTSEHVLVLNGDSWCAVDYLDFERFHRLNAAELSLTLAQVDDSERYGSVEITNDGRVVRFAEKMGETTAWINAGVSFVSRKLIESIPAGEPVSFERLLVPRWLAEGNAIFGYRHEGSFIDIGTPESYRLAGTCMMMAAGANANRQPAGRRES